jgi:hypothetical protein
MDVLKKELLHVQQRMETVVKEKEHNQKILEIENSRLNAELNT